MELFASQDPRPYSLYFDLNIWFRARKVTGTFNKTGPRFSLICQTDSVSIDDTSIWKSLNEAKVRIFGLCYVGKIQSKNITCCPSYVLNPLISNIGLSITYNSPLTSNFFLKFLRNKVFSPCTKSFRKISWKVNDIPTNWISFIM